MRRSMFLVLEALLRLRQAACHPGLIDRRRGDEPCAKLDTLLPLLQEVVSEGSKALVFSQLEEKVLSLQGGKRALAEAVVRADESILGELDHAELERLLS